MYKSIFFLVFLSTTSSIFAQAKLTWNDFADVSFEPEYNEKYDVHFLMPKFGTKIKSYRGKEVEITGYFLDISGTGEVLLLSANPMASCFFCGSAGPESVIEVNFEKKPSFSTDQVVKVKGILELNRDNVDHCNYILKNAMGELVN